MEITNQKTCSGLLDEMQQFLETLPLLDSPSPDTTNKGAKGPPRDHSLELPFRLKRPCGEELISCLTFCCKATPRSHAHSLLSVPFLPGGPGERTTLLLLALVDFTAPTSYQKPCVPFQHAGPEQRFQEPPFLMSLRPNPCKLLIFRVS